MKKFVRRNDQTAHISLQISSISKSQRQKTLVAPVFLGAPAARSVAFFVTVECFAPPVRGYLRIVGYPRKCFFQKNDIFLNRRGRIPVFRGFPFENNKNGGFGDIRLRRIADGFASIWNYPQNLLGIRRLRERLGGLSGESRAEVGAPEAPKPPQDRSSARFPRL